MNRYDDSQVPHFRDLILSSKGVCAGFSCLLSDMASLIGLKVYTGRAPQHVYLYTGWKDLFIETTRFYNLRLAGSGRQGTENFDPEKLHPADVVIGQLEYLDYTWSRMPTEYLKLLSNISRAEKDRSHYQSKLAFRYLEEGKVEKGVSLLQDLLVRDPKTKIPMDGPDSLDEIAHQLKNRDNPRAAQLIYDFGLSLPSRNQGLMEYIAHHEAIPVHQEDVLEDNFPFLKQR
jgi:hypothetical protein